MKTMTAKYDSQLADRLRLGDTCYFAKKHLPSDTGKGLAGIAPLGIQSLAGKIWLKPQRAGFTMKPVRCVDQNCQTIKKKLSKTPVFTP